MLGPLPRMHRWILIAVSLLVCVASGAWLAWFTPVPIVASAGALIGAAAGVVAAYAMVHDFGHPEPHRARLRHHR